MSDEKRPGAGETPPAPNPEAAPPSAEPDFFEDGEHDGWSPIVKRRTPSDPAPERADDAQRSG